MRLHERTIRIKPEIARYNDNLLEHILLQGRLLFFIIEDIRRLGVFEDKF